MPSPQLAVDKDNLKNDTVIPLLEANERYPPKGHWHRVPLRRRGSPWSYLTSPFSPNARDIIYLILSVALNIVLATYFSRLMTQRANTIWWKGDLPKYSELLSMMSVGDSLSMMVSLHLANHPRSRRWPLQA